MIYAFLFNTLTSGSDPVAVGYFINGLLLFLPRLVAAIVIFLVGWLIAILFGKITYRLVKALHLNWALEGIGLKKGAERAGLKLDAPYFFQELVKWFFLLIFLMAAANVLGFGQVADFLKTVVLYVPHVIIAALILLIGILAARFLEKVVHSSMRAAGLALAGFLSLVVRWAVLVFSFLIALDQLGVAQEIIRIFIFGIVAMVSLAGGLAFGLGGKEYAQEWLSSVKKKASTKS